MSAGHALPAASPAPMPPGPFDPGMVKTMNRARLDFPQLQAAIHGAVASSPPRKPAIVGFSPPCLSSARRQGFSGVNNRCRRRGRFRSSRIRFLSLPWPAGSGLWSKGTASQCHAQAFVQPNLELRVNATTRAKALPFCCFATVRFWPILDPDRCRAHHALRSSRSFRNTVRWSGCSGNSGKASRNFAITVGLLRRKNVLTCLSTSSVAMAAPLGS